MMIGMPRSELVAPPTYSVVIAAFNPGPLLNQAVESVINQSYADWELIVVDDGSTEDLTWIRSVDPRVRLLRTANGGVSVARNRGIAATTGLYVAFLDQDDVWRPTKLDRQRAALDSGENFSYTAFDLIDSDGQRIGPGYGRRVSHRDLLAGEFGVLLSSAVVERQTLLATGLFNPKLRCQQDLDLFIRLARAEEAAFVTSVEVDYRLHEGNASRDYWQSVRELLALYDIEKLTALRDNDIESIKSLKVGRSRVRRNYAFQAVDAMRKAPYRQDTRRLVTDLWRVAKLSPWVLALSAWQAATERLRRIS
jgi:glycosyltransferase involved in cell wall biosynthesis